MLRLVLYRDKAIRWRWRLTAANAEIVCASSQSFSSRQKCEENFSLVRHSDIRHGET